jgi:hypothetical protein
MPKDVPTADQIRAYLLANGWQMGESGRAAYLMVRMGHTVRMLHEPTVHNRFQAVFDISLIESRHPADVRKDILACATAAAAVAAALDAPAAGDVIATLTACRIALGLSQRRVGFLSGLGTSVCEYEAGRHAPTLPKLIAWADSVGCDVTVTVRPKAKQRRRAPKSPTATTGEPA